MPRTQIFVSYAHADNEAEAPCRRWLDRLLIHLRPLMLEGHTITWSDKEIEIGDDWHVKIQACLETAKVAILLVSPAFLASKYIRNSELPVLFRRASDEGVIILPVILRPCLFRTIKFKYPDPTNGPQEFSLASLQAANSPNRALSEMSESEQDRVFTILAERIQRILVDNKDVLDTKRIKPDSHELANTDLNNREKMIARVRHFWIQGVLYQPIYKLPRLELELSHDSDAIEYPFELIIRQPGEDTQQLAPKARAITVFDDFEQALLILGAPGSGKTTLLLELVEDLLERAEKNISYPIPVVFNLSSWSQQQLPLNQWLTEELNKNYGIPRKIAAKWIKNEQIAPMLDGLDEVSQKQRGACVQTINQYRLEHGLTPLVVCSRIADYEQLNTKLKLHAAIVIQPLKRSQIERYMAQDDQSIIGLKYALQSDGILWQLIDTPLMLGVAALAYQDFSQIDQEKPIKEFPPQKHREQLLEKYVEAMPKRSGRAMQLTNSIANKPKKPQDFENFKNQLAWLAQAMKNESQSEFHLSWLQPSCLSSQSQQIFFNSLVGLSVALISGIFTAVFLGLNQGIFYGLLFGALTLNPLFGGLILTTIGLVLVIYYQLESFELGIYELDTPLILLISFLFVLFVYPLTCLVVKIFGYPKVIRPANAIRWSRQNAEIGAKIGMAYGFILIDIKILFFLVVGEFYFFNFIQACLVGIIFGALIGGFSKREMNSQITNNTPFYSLILCVMGIIIGLFSAVLVSGTSLTFSWIGPSSHEILMANFPFFILYGAFYFGGFAAIQHYVLRAMITLQKKAPWNFVDFLEKSVNLLYLRKVGAGYIFAHRVLLEYFASLHSDTAKNSNKTRNEVEAKL
ncbi:MAG: TIR domain-containing protein [Burkholderiales bacterium]|nr:TIR domain-containing protein [Nitrosomonas sp.]MCP5276271.1 TIR domain-containing protein [Burkholderiales bacterium]